ncbi:hypothetical protein SAMN04488570_1371 [Nocardioides scoriae]|uniref:Uncharacterized protein n=1 Tax=Nocardioides scoriae TaxID=642780 RepID=A0A1H1QBU8_9ACTN|nr:hypothetical protein [Nocardioides scoriae]SDS20895.1 hypothetical protein SAMN04488570_1371 [Nocardioides scoriae]
MDIWKVTLVNEERLTVRIVVDDLQKKAGRSASALLDTNPDQPGAEFQIGSGLYDSDWQIFKVGGNEPLNCPIEQGLNYQSDVIRWTTGPKCLGKYSKVRVRVATQSGGNKDYSPGPKSMHPWVARF